MLDGAVVAEDWLTCGANLQKHLTCNADYRISMLHNQALQIEQISLSSCQCSTQRCPIATRQYPSNWHLQDRFD
jgi:hypothetical protein